jgi:hypothetical protein
MWKRTTFPTSRSDVSGSHPDGVGRVADAILIARDIPIGLPPSKRMPVNPDLRHHVEAVLCSATGGEFPVKIERVRISSAHLRGGLARYRDHAKVWLSADLNLCWSRFVACKELMHLLADDQQHFARDPVHQIESVLRGYHWTLDKALDSETFAVVLALEYLFRWECRPRLEDSTRGSNFQIADRFKIPEAIVDGYFSSSLASISEQANAQLDEQ